MARVSNKREMLLSAARELFHRQGYSRTSLADIAEESGVPLGNVYYYFKTKEDLVAAIVQTRIENFEQFINGLGSLSEPRQRLVAYLTVPAENCDVVKSFGCPVGSLVQELNKEAPSLKGKADAMVRAHLDWLEAQFRVMGRADAPALARYVLATLQGASLLTNTLADASVMTEQVARLKAWVEQI